MKRNLLMILLVTASLVSFTGCKKDDDASIVGTWHIQKDVYKQIVNGQTTVEETENYEKGVYSYTFTGDGKFTALDEGEDDGSGTYVYANGNLALTYKEAGETDYTTTEKVKELSSGSLVLVSEDEFTQNGITTKTIYEEYYVK